MIALQKSVIRPLERNLFITYLYDYTLSRPQSDSQTSKFKRCINRILTSSHTFVVKAMRLINIRDYVYTFILLTLFFKVTFILNIKFFSTRTVIDYY